MRYEIFSNNNYSPLNVYAIGFCVNPQITRFGPGRRNAYIIHYVTKGQGYFNGNLIKEGQGFLITPGMMEEYHPDKNNAWEFLWTYSSDTGMREVFKRYNADQKTNIFNYDSVDFVKKIANDIKESNGAILDSLEMLEIFLQILNSHTHKEILDENKSTRDIYLDFCINYIETNIHEKVTVNDLSRLVGVSQSYLHRLFNTRFNLSTKEYITRIKLNHAIGLLTETDISITEISNSVGYSDVLSFSKAFSAKEGISPQKYRSLYGK